MGISGMNGLSDQQELTTAGDLDPDPRLGQVARPRPARLLGGQPRPPLPRRRRGRPTAAASPRTTGSSPASPPASETPLNTLVDLGVVVGTKPAQGRVWATTTPRSTRRGAAAARARRRAARRRAGRGGAAGRREGGAARGRGGRERGRGMVRAAMDTLSRRGRAARVAVTVIGAALLLAGTLWGQDDDFPFGPFRMYATAPDPRRRRARHPGRGRRRDRRARSRSTEGNSGLRRAEIEGQQPAYVAAPEPAAAGGDRVRRAQPGRARAHRRPDRHPLARHRGRPARPATSTRPGRRACGPPDEPRGCPSRCRAAGSPPSVRSSTCSSPPTWSSSRRGCAATPTMPGNLYQPLLVGRLLPLPTPTPLLVHAVFWAAARARARGRHRAGSPGRSAGPCSRCTSSG